MQLQDVYFAYPNSPKNIVLKGANIKAHPGKTVALVGPSGSGKSTVIAMLQRFYDPLAGVLVGEVFYYCAMRTHIDFFENLAEWVEHLFKCNWIC